MIDKNNETMLEKLKQFLHYKKSKSFYASKLGISEKEVDDLLREIREQKIFPNSNQTPDFSRELIMKFEEDFEKGLGSVTINVDEEIKSLDDLVVKCKIDTKKWNILKYVQNYWGNKENPNWQVKAWLSVKSTEHAFRDGFMDFLSTYNPSRIYIDSPKIDENKPTACILINKQDAHFNREDGFGSDNDIEKRFINIFVRTKMIIDQAAISNNVEKILYILGSDEFNSEFGEKTTRGTPQENILSYHDAFERICNHEVETINMMLERSQTVDITFIPGNHDEFVGWHMVSWLKAYFKDEPRITFDISPSDRKYISYGKSLMMFNHGDRIKPERLVTMFPIEYREGWSSHENFYIFSGDKHVEKSEDFNGIEFFRLSALSTVSSRWESDMGYKGRRPKVTGFLIDKELGMTNILKQYL